MRRIKRMKKFVALGLAAILACGSVQSTWAAGEEEMKPAAAEAVSANAPGEKAAEGTEMPGTAAAPAAAEMLGTAAALAEGTGASETAAASAESANKSTTAPTPETGTIAGAKTDSTSLEQPAPGAGAEPTLPTEPAPGAGAEPTLPTEPAPGAGTEPTLPTESTSGAGAEPTAPTESVSGTEVGTEPTVPTEPTPGGETESTKPTVPTDPATEEGTKPTAPTESLTGEGTESTVPTEPAPGEGTGAAVPTEPAPGEGTGATVPTDSTPGGETGSTKPTAPADPTPGEGTGSAAPSEPEEGSGSTTPAEKPSDESTAPKQDTDTSGDSPKQDQTNAAPGTNKADAAFDEEAGNDELGDPSDGSDEQTTYEVVYHLENANDDGYTVYDAAGAREQGALGNLQEELLDKVCTKYSKEYIEAATYADLTVQGHEIIPKRIVGFAFDKIEVDSTEKEFHIYYKRMRFPAYWLIYSDIDAYWKGRNEIDLILDRAVAWSKAEVNKKANPNRLVDFSLEKDLPSVDGSLKKTRYMKYGQQYDVNIERDLGLEADENYWGGYLLWVSGGTQDGCLTEKEIDNIFGASPDKEYNDRFYQVAKTGKMPAGVMCYIAFYKDPPTPYNVNYMVKTVDGKFRVAEGNDFSEGKLPTEKQYTIYTPSDRRPLGDWLNEEYSDEMIKNKYGNDPQNPLTAEEIQQFRWKEFYERTSGEVGSLTNDIKNPPLKNDYKLVAIYNIDDSSKTITLLIEQQKIECPIHYEYYYMGEKLTGVDPLNSANLPGTVTIRTEGIEYLNSVKNASPMSVESSAKAAGVKAKIESWLPEANNVIPASLSESNNSRSFSYYNYVIETDIDGSITGITLVYLQDVGALKITVDWTGGVLRGSNPSKVFTLTRTDVPGFEMDIIVSSDWQETGAKQIGTATIYGLPVGTYNLAEKKSWSWDYGAAIESGETVKITKDQTESCEKEAANVKRVWYHSENWGTSHLKLLE